MRNKKPPSPAEAHGAIIIGTVLAAVCLIAAIAVLVYRAVEPLVDILKVP